MVNMCIDCTTGYAGLSGMYGNSDQLIEDMTAKTANSTAKTANGTETLRRRREARRRRGLTATAGEAITYVANPTVCFERHTVMRVAVDADNYPQYDKNALQNKKGADGIPFEEGPFIQLKDAVKSDEYDAFYYQFSAPGTHVLYNVADPNAKTIITVQEDGVSCAGGTFEPQTAQAIHLGGVTQEDDFEQAPDWRLIGGLFGGGFTIMVLIMIAVSKLGNMTWDSIFNEDEGYKARQKAMQLLGMGSLSSKTAPEVVTAGGTDVDDLINAIDMIDGKESNSHSRIESSGNPTEGDFWDSREQKKEEDFSVRKLNAELDKHHLGVLDQFEDGGDAMAHQADDISTDHGAIKQLWLAKTDAGFQSNFETEGTLQSLAEKMEEIGNEQERRREIGRDMDVMLTLMLKQHRADLDSRDRHQGKQHGLVEEFSQRLRVISDVLKSPDTVDVKGVLSDQVLKLDSLHTQYTAVFRKEAYRVGVPYAIEGASDDADYGAVFVDSSNRLEAKVLDLSGFRDATGHLTAADGVLQYDAATKLLRPCDASFLKFPNGDISSPIGKMCVHPETGKVYSDDGNLAYSKAAGKLVVTMGSVGIADTTKLVPYIPYPDGNNVPAMKIKPLRANQDFKLGALFREPMHRFEVPIMGCTCDAGGTILPVGGLYTDPVSKMLAPISLNAPMEVDGQLRMIVGVRFDVATGQVVPVCSRPFDEDSGSDASEAGTLKARKRKSKKPKFFIGTLVEHPLTDVLTRVTGITSFVDDDGIESCVPLFGGPLALIRETELSRELAASGIMDEIVGRTRATITAHANGQMDGSAIPVYANWISSQTAKLSAASSAWAAMCNESYTTSAETDLGLCVDQTKWTEVSNTGNVLGSIMYGLTGTMLPLLPGEKLLHNASGLNVPILGVGKDPWSDADIPLAGAMLASDGDEAIPIQIGKEFIDDNGHRVHVAGANRSTDGEIGPTTNPNQRFPPIIEVTTKSLNDFSAKVALRKGHIRRHGVAASGLVKSCEGLHMFLMKTDYTNPMDLVESLTQLCERAKQAEMQFKRACSVGDASSIASVFLQDRPGPYTNASINNYMEMMWNHSSGDVPRFVTERLESFESRAALSLAWVAELHVAIRVRIETLAKDLAEIRKQHRSPTFKKMQKDASEEQKLFALMARYQATLIAARRDAEKRVKQLIVKIDTEHQHLLNIWDNENADTIACADLMGLTLRIAKLQESEESVMQAALERLIGQISSGSMTVQSALLSIGELIQNADADAVLQDDANGASPEPNEEGDGSGTGDVISEANAEAAAADAEVSEDAKQKLVAENERLEKAASKLEEKMAKSQKAMNAKLASDANALLEKVAGNMSQSEMEDELAKFQASAKDAQSKKQTEQKAALALDIRSVSDNADAEYMNAFLSDDFLANMIDFEPSVDADTQLESTFAQIHTEDDLFNFGESFMIDFEPSMDGGVQLNSKFARPINISDATAAVVTKKAESVETGISDLGKEMRDLALGDPDSILNAAAAADRRRRLAAARARMTANQSLSAKLRNTLAARLKGLESKLEELEKTDLTVTAAKRKGTMAASALSIEDELAAIEGELQDPDAIISADASAERRRRLQAMRARLEANNSLDAKLRNRLAAKLKAFGTVESEVALIVDPDGAAHKALAVKEGVDVAAIAQEEKRKAKIKLATMRQNVANMKQLMMKGLNADDVPPAVRMALLALEDQADKLEKKIIEDSAGSVLNRVVDGNAEKLKAAAAGLNTGGSNEPSRMDRAAIRGAVDRSNKLEAQKVEKLQKLVDKSTTSSKGAAALVKAAGVSLEALEEQHTEKQYQLRLEHEKKIREMEAEAAKVLKAEEELAMSKLDGLFTAEQERLVTDSSKDFEVVMEERAEMLNQEDAEMLMKDHETSKATRDARLAAERSKQKDALKTRLAAAKKAKLARIAKMQGLETDELNEKMANEQRAADTKEMRAQAMAGMKDTSQKTVLETLEATHKVEMSDLIVEHNKLATIRIARAVENANEDRAAEREALTIAHSKELVRYANENGNVEDGALFEKGRKELIAMHDGALKRFDEQNESIITAAETHATSSEALKLSARQLELRETQCREVADTLARLHPSASLSREYEAKAEAAAKEANEQRRNIAAHNKDNIQRKKDEMRERFKTEQEARLEAIASQMVAVDNEIVAEKEKTKAYVAAKVAEKQEELAEKQAVQDAAALEAKVLISMTEDEGERMMKQAADDAASALKALAENRSAQQGTIAKRLAERRAKKAAAEALKAPKAPEKKAAGRGSPCASDDDEADAAFPSGNDESSNQGRAHGSVQYASIPDNVLEKVKAIEALIANRGGMPFTSVKYIDPVDKSWANGATSLRSALVKRSDLSSDEEKALQFGMRQATLLSDQWELDTVTIKTVNDLPSDTASGHAFPCSYSYNPASATLYIRRQRLENVGVFMMVVLHGLAHIKVDSMVDDTNPHFIEAFYNGLQIVSSKLFEARSKAADPIDSLASGNPADAREKRFDGLMDLSV
jgi:hypothetical protein